MEPLSVWFHGTNKSGLIGILEFGFKPNRGLFGEGIYFTSTKDGARIFGDQIVKVEIDHSRIHSIDFSDFFKRYPNENDWGRAAELGYPAVAFFYGNGEVELVVYQADLIQTNDL